MDSYQRYLNSLSDREHAMLRFDECGETGGLAHFTRKPAPDEKYLRYRHLPVGGRSYNHRDGYAEEGVSVYRIRRINGRWYRDCNWSFAACGDEVYEVMGDVLLNEDGTEATGSDGEPLLINARIIKRHRKSFSDYPTCL